MSGGVSQYDYYALRQQTDSQMSQNQLAEARYKQQLAMMASQAQCGLWSGYLGTPRAASEAFKCRYCGTKRQDKAHNCRNCAGLETV